ncbi:MAG: Uma2 family endonuclease [Verrucomicrobiaceae bacterium]|nr:Uma2 family endonuclease [Verrucomicrobiaceae bacterium]
MPSAPLLDLAALFASPRLPDIAQEINERLRRENEVRRQFYHDMTDDCKMEFIGGEVIMHSPAKARHVRVKDNLLRMVQNFVISRDLGEVMGEKALCVFPRNDYEPDIVFFGPEKTAAIRPDTMKFPVPDFAVEVLSESTEERDRGVKFQDYEAHGVREYWIINADEEWVEQYVEKDGRYELRLKSGSGEIASTAIPGFVVPVRAIFDTKESLRVMQTLLE